MVTSSIAVLEVLVVPYRAGDLALAGRYEALLTRSSGLELIDATLDQLRTAAQLRARFKIKTPDALQLTAAISRGCTSLVTNDREFPTIPGLRILQLRDYIRPPAKGAARPKGR